MYQIINKDNLLLDVIEVISESIDRPLSAREISDVKEEINYIVGSMLDTKSDYIEALIKLFKETK